MNSQTATIVSGIILLLVFALVGWNLRRRRDRPGRDNAGSGTHHDDSG